MMKNLIFILIYLIIFVTSIIFFPLKSYANINKNSAKLQSLRINTEGIVPNFDSDIYEYDITVKNEINDIEVLAVAENPKSKINIVGNNRIERRSKFNKNKGNFRR